MSTRRYGQAHPKDCRCPACTPPYRGEASISDLLKDLDACWSFDNGQQHTHSWHDKQDFMEKWRDASAAPATQKAPSTPQAGATPESDECTGHCICHATEDEDVTPRSKTVSLELRLSAALAELDEAINQWNAAVDACDRTTLKLAEARKDTERVNKIEELARGHRDHAFGLIASEAPATKPGWKYFVKGHEGPTLRDAIDQAV